MHVTVVRAYWREALEFLGYFVFMTVMGAAMFVLVCYSPQAHASWYINTCVFMAILTGGYAFRMYRRYRAALRISRPTPEPIDAAPHQLSPEERRRRNWSERMSGERLRSRETDPERVKLLFQLEAVEDAYRARCKARGEDPDPSSFEVNPGMTVAEIRRRIASRLDL